MKELPITLTIDEWIEIFTLANNSLSLDGEECNAVDKLADILGKEHL